MPDCSSRAAHTHGSAGAAANYSDFTTVLLLCGGRAWDLKCVYAGGADQAERDARSIFIGNVDFSTSVEEVFSRQFCPVCVSSVWRAVSAARTFPLEFNLFHKRRSLLSCAVGDVGWFHPQVQALFADCGEINASALPTADRSFVLVVAPSYFPLCTKLNMANETVMLTPGGNLAGYHYPRRQIHRQSQRFCLPGVR